MFVVLSVLVIVVVVLVLVAGVKFLSPKQGGLKNENLFFKLFKTLFELVSFLVPACVISALFVIPIDFLILGTLHDTPVGDNIYQQIYNYIQMTGGVLGLGIGVIAGMILTLVIRNTAHLNRIEEKITEIQEKLNKEQK